MNPELFGKWYVYKYNLSRHVLKAPETSLEITEIPPGIPDGSDCLARFELSGLDDPVTVEMVEDVQAGAWYGEEDTFDFRWARVEHGGADILIGQASDRSNSAYRDLFVAVRSQRAISLPPRKKIYNFTAQHLIPLKRTGRSEDKLGTFSVDLRDGSSVKLEGTTYALKESLPYKGGLKLTGEYIGAQGEIKQLGLWILPNDESGGLLATGYYFHRPPIIVSSGPSNPMCQLSVHLC